MAKSLKDWIEENVSPFRDKAILWLSENHSFRDPSRPLVSAPSYFFASADSIVLYQRPVEPYRRIVGIGGRNFTLRDAKRDPTHDRESQVNLQKTKGERNEEPKKAERLHDCQHPSVRLGPVWIGACSGK